MSRSLRIDSVLSVICCISRIQINHNWFCPANPLNHCILTKSKGLAFVRIKYAYRDRSRLYYWRIINLKKRVTRVALSRGLVETNLDGVDAGLEFGIFHHFTRDPGISVLNPASRGNAGGNGIRR